MAKDEITHFILCPVYRSTRMTKVGRYTFRRIIMGFLDTLRDVIIVVSKAAEAVNSKMEKDYEEWLARVRSKRSKSPSASSMHRSTKEAFRNVRAGMDRRPESYSTAKHVPLSYACDSAPSEPGIYILYLRGRV